MGEASVTSKYYTLKKHFVGLPREDNFEVVEKVLPPLADGEFLVECDYLSVDPYMRPYSRKLKEGSKMVGTGVGHIKQSKNPDYPVGSIVTGPFGWASHAIPDKSLVQSNMFRIIPEIKHISYALGTLGLTGMTAYFGFLDICTPKAGETVFVNAAAGATGAVVGQIAKIKGCRVIGCAGSDEKCAYLKEIGFDSAINYKTENLDQQLTALCPRGIDCFFDNVGGEMYDTTMKHMNRFGRISLCGCISLYNENLELEGTSDIKPALGSSKGPYIHFEAIPKELKIQGFLAPSSYNRFDEAFKQLSEWIDEGKIKVSEHVVEGFENMPSAFISLFHGKNIGKIVVKLT